MSLVSIAGDLKICTIDDCPLFLDESSSTAAQDYDGNDCLPEMPVRN
jgi:hypothetical protein